MYYIFCLSFEIELFVNTWSQHRKHEWFSSAPCAHVCVQGSGVGRAGCPIASQVQVEENETTEKKNVKTIVAIM